MGWLRCVVCVLALLGGEAFARTPDLWNVPVSFAPFWGRKGELLALKEKLAKGPVAVTGLSGIGKSRLAFAYAKKYASKYRIVWVFDTSQGMDNQMITFANKLHGLENKGKKGTFTKKEEASHYMKTLLRTCAFSWLLIFDGAQSFASASDSLPDTFGWDGKDVIVTSTSSSAAPQTLEVTPFSDPEALSFLKAGLPGQGDEDLANLAQTLGNHPMALEQAVTYINGAPGVDAQAYVTLFNGNKAKFWTSEHQALQGQTTLHTSLKMSLDKLLSENPAAFQALCFFAMVDTSHIDTNLIHAWYAKTQDGDTAAFSQLTSRSLIAGNEGGAFTMHGYLRDVVLSEADAAIKGTAATHAGHIFAGLFPEKIEDCVGVFEKDPALVGHMKALMTHMDLMPADEAFAAGLRLFYYVGSIERNYEYASPLSEKLQYYLEDGRIKDPYKAGVFKSWYGDAKITTSGLDASIEELRKADAFFEKVEDKEKSRVEHVMLLANNLGFFLHWKGNLKEASACLERAKGLQGVHTETNAWVAIYELEAVLAQDTGAFDRALDTTHRELEMLKTDPVYERVDGHFVKSLKACSLLKMAEMKAYTGDTDAAKHLRQEALHVSEDAYKHALASADGQEDAEIVGRTLVYLSQAQSSLGDAKRGEETAKRAIAIFENAFGKEPSIRRQGVAYIALGDALTGQGKHEEAYAAYAKAEEIFTKISTHLAFDDMSEVWTRLVANAIARDDTYTMERCRLLHMKTFDGLHPRYIEIARLVTTP